MFFKTAKNFAWKKRFAFFPRKIGICDKKVVWAFLEFYEQRDRESKPATMSSDVFERRPVLAQENTKGIIFWSQWISGDSADNFYCEAKEE